MEKLEAAQQKVTKIEGTIVRHEQQAAKKRAEIHKRGYNENDRYCMQGTAQHNDAYWLICEYSSKLEDIKGAQRKLRDAQVVVANWQEKLSKQLKLEQVYEMEMPVIFKQCQQDLAEQWTAADIRAREQMRKNKQELSYEEFRKLYKWTQEDELNKTDAQLKDANMHTAEAFIIDLYNRVKAVTGNVTDWSNIHYGGKALNGIVKGENGTARVETIGAGGYNIQRYHLRVLVHEA